MMPARIVAPAAAFRDALVALALPYRCPECAAIADPAQVLCDSCLASIPRLALALCAKCSARGADPVGCLRHPGHAVWPAWIYDEAAAAVVSALKYGERPGVAGALGGELARVAPGARRWDLVLAVPLHRARRRERGYNQAACLAQALAFAMGAPFFDGVPERIRATSAQARLDAHARRRNLRGAFRVRSPHPLAGRRVLLVDDVMTTGATLEACLDALHSAGAETAAVTLAWAQ